jgi:hypothetical protein
MNYPNIDNKIMSDQFRHNMGPWLTEKSENGLESLVEMRKVFVEKKDSLDPELLEYLNTLISGVMWDLSKIYSFSLGTAWEPADRDLLYDKLNDGFEELKVKYGMLDKTTKQKKKDDYDEFLKKIGEYLELDQVPGRTYLQGLLDNNSKFIDVKTISGMLLRKMETELYNVANGQLSWHDFLVLAKELIGDLHSNNRGA